MAYLHKIRVTFIAIAISCIDQCPAARHNLRIETSTITWILTCTPADMKLYNKLALIPALKFNFVLNVEDSLFSSIILITIFINLRLSLVSNLYMDHNNMV